MQIASLPLLTRMARARLDPSKKPDDDQKRQDQEIYPRHRQPTPLRVRRLSLVDVLRETGRSRYIRGTAQALHVALS